MWKQVLTLFFVLCGSFQWTLGQQNLNLTRASLNIIKPYIQMIIRQEEQQNWLNWVKIYREKNPLEGYDHVLYIHRDQIPPASFYQKWKMQSADGPAVAVSGFDHHSKLWHSCTTENTNFIKHLDKLTSVKTKEEAFECAIFANLKCLRDVETTLHIDEKIFPVRSAFWRYQTGFMDIVNTHHRINNINTSGKNHLIQWIRDSVNNANLKDGWLKADKTLMSECCQPSSGCQDANFSG